MVPCFHSPGRARVAFGSSSTAVFATLATFAALGRRSSRGSGSNESATSMVGSEMIEPALLRLAFSGLSWIIGGGVSPASTARRYSQSPW